MVRATFADPLGRTVNLHLDADSVRPGLPIDDPEVVAFQVLGGTIEPYEPPVIPTDSEIDQRALNEALTTPGSVLRALAEVTFQEINRLRVRAGLAAYTKPQFVDALKANMRNP